MIKLKRKKICGECEREIINVNSCGQKFHKGCWLIKRARDKRRDGKKYYQKHKKRINEYSKQHEQRPIVKERRKEQKKIYYLENEVKIKEKSKKYKSENPKLVKLLRKRNREKHKSRIVESNKEYNQRSDVKERLRAYYKKRRKEDKGYNAQMRLRALVGLAFRRFLSTGKIMVSKKYGINYKEIIEHLKPFPEDISKYHIDHIRPLCSFDFTDQEQIKQAFAPENHQWLLARDNRVKGGKWEEK